MIKEIDIPEKIEVEIVNNIIKIKGPKVELSKSFNDPRFTGIVKIEKKDNKLIISGELTKILVGFTDDLSAIQRTPKEGFTDIYRDTWRTI